MTRLSLDAGFAIAAASPRDQRHSPAVEHWTGLLRSGVLITTTSFVVDEVATFLNGKREHAAAVSMGRILMDSSQVDLVHVDERLFAAGWDYFASHQDKRYSLTDCISFVVMEQRGLRLALTFDHHFAQAGFECLPA